MVNGYITAASTSRRNTVMCLLTANRETASLLRCISNTVENFAKTVFINCYMDSHIKSEGWHNWNRPESEKTVFYAEYKSHGPGAGTGKRVSWARILTDDEAKDYTVEKIIPWAVR